MTHRLFPPTSVCPRARAHLAIARTVAAFVAVGALAGCSGEQYQDLRQYMHETDRSLPRKIDPLPQAQSYEPFTYDAFNLPDPFKPRALKLSTETTHANDQLAPDPNRRKEPLEAFPLNQLRMVGILQQQKTMYALVLAENTIQRVTAGNYLGQNDGLIVGISETEIRLKEKVQDAGGDWSERLSTLKLTEASQEKGK